MNVINKRYLCVFLGLGILFSNTDSLGAVSGKEAIFCTGLSFLAATGGAYATYKFFDHISRPFEKLECLTAATVFGALMFIFPVVVGCKLYKNTYGYLLREALKLYEQAQEQKMFPVAKKYCDDYEGLMKKIDVEYDAHENPLMGAYNNLAFMREILSKSKEHFSQIKKLVCDGKISLCYVARYGLTIDDIESDIALIDTYLQDILKTIKLIKSTQII